MRKQSSKMGKFTKKTAQFQNKMRKQGTQKMFKNERLREIMNILREEGYATVEMLSQRLYISPSSVRRDLTQLEKQNQVRRSYGGVELAKNNSRAVPFSMRMERQVEQKRLIAQKAAALVREKDIVYLDQSSTALYLAQELADSKKITIVTNNMEILNSIYSLDNITIYSSGGSLAKPFKSLTGEDAAATFRRMRADFAFFSTQALSPEGVIYDDVFAEVLVRQAMLENANKKVFLCDREKFDRFSGYRQCALNQVDYMISDVPCREKYSRFAPNVEFL
jgi:DeoR/GlpR family transcriptional regulator of sugar metabolism